MAPTVPSTQEVSTALAAASLDLAQRFHAGATLWAAAPEWPWHAQHVAVEFVHPVIVGKRALPALALPATGWPDELLAGSRPGDVLVLIAAADRPGVAESLSRARVWGLTTILLAPGPSPAANAADHVVALGADAAVAAHDGTVVRGYHVLWELTHVCFEHPGLLARPSAPGSEDRCVTCSDEGRLAEVLSLGAGAVASVRSASGVEQVDLTLVDDARPGDFVLVHAGTALTVVGSPG